MYISYSRWPESQSDLVRAFAQELRYYGVHTFLDQFELNEFGKSYIDWVDRNMLNPRVDFIFIILSKQYPYVASQIAEEEAMSELDTPNALAAKLEVQYFKRYVDDKKKTFVPVYLGGLPMGFDVPPLLGSSQLYVVDSSFTSNGWEKLIFRLFGKNWVAT